MEVAGVQARTLVWRLAFYQVEVQGLSELKPCASIKIWNFEIESLGGVNNNGGSEKNVEAGQR